MWLDHRSTNDSLGGSTPRTPESSPPGRKVFLQLVSSKCVHLRGRLTTPVCFHSLSGTIQEGGFLIPYCLESSVRIESG